MIRTHFRTGALAALAAAAASLSAPAHAQDEAAAAPSGEEVAAREDKNSLTVGIGGAYRPSYEGSDDYTLGPIGALFGKVEGFSFTMRGTGLSIDLIRDGRDSPVSVELGPLVYVRLDRTSGIKDPQVRALGEIDTAIEVGGVAGISKNGVLHQYDSLGVRLQYQRDVSNTHDSSILTPTIEYSTPFSTRTFAQLSLSAERVGDGYARTYFSITPTGAAASGLPGYNADGGWKNWRTSLFLAHTLTGELRDPKLSLFSIMSYGRLLGEFKRSPIVSMAGDKDQFFGLLGLSYTF